MDLSELFDMQRTLDERIVKEKGLEGVDLVPEKILALQVELGECANEWRGFKFWSNDQLPRDMEITIGNVCGDEKVRYPVLEEYVDCLHFVLSLGNDLVHRKDVKTIDRENIGYVVYNRFEITSQFNQLFSILGELWDHGEIDLPYHDFIAVFINLGESLGFTWDEVVMAYKAKNAINHQRQEEGY